MLFYFLLPKSLDISISTFDYIGFADYLVKLTASQVGLEKFKQASAIFSANQKFNFTKQGEVV